MTRFELRTSGIRATPLPTEPQQGPARRVLRLLSSIYQKAPFCSANKTDWLKCRGSEFNWGKCSSELIIRWWSLFWISCSMSIFFHFAFLDPQEATGWKVTLQPPPPTSKLFFKMGQLWRLFNLFSSFQTHITNFTTNRYVKNVLPV